MSLAARCADQLTQSQTRWSIRCVPFRVIEGNFSLWRVHFFIRIRRPKLTCKCSVLLSSLDRWQEA